jgi:hypothetical protein
MCVACGRSTAYCGFVDSIKGRSIKGRSLSLDSRAVDTVIHHLTRETAVDFSLSIGKFLR